MKILSIITLIFCTALLANAQTVRQMVTADGDGIVTAPANFWGLNEIPTLTGDNTFSGNNTFTGTVSLSLAEEVTFQRVNIGDPDYGWQYNPAAGGQLEFVFPGGTAAFYETGIPARPYMYFPGKIQADTIAGNVEGVTINASGLTGTIPSDVVKFSLAPPLGDWWGDETNAPRGITWANTGPSGTSEPTPGNTYYYPTAFIVAGIPGSLANAIQGRYRTGVQFSAQTHPSESATLDFPSIAAGGSQTLTITVAGAVTAGTPSVQLGWSAELPAGVVVSQAWVSAANTVSVRLSNITAAAIDPPAITCRVSITQY
ncbi:MAG: hypothetical protein ACOVMP_00530 [Chthoniobacterales bacterium]